MTSQIMTELKSKYQEVESGIQWPKKNQSITTGNQFNSIMEDLRNKIRERSFSDKIDSDVYEGRLNIMVGFMQDLQKSLNGPRLDKKTRELKKFNENEQYIWHHRSKPFICTDNIRKGLEPKIDEDLLVKTIAVYILNPWLQSNEIEWILMDSLIFAAISDYEEDILKGKKMKREKHQEQADSLKLILDVYFYCTPPIINLSLLQKLMNKAVEKGVCLSGTLFALVDKISKNNTEPYFIIESSYREI